MRDTSFKFNNENGVELNLFFKYNNDSNIDKRIIQDNNDKQLAQVVYSDISSHQLKYIDEFKQSHIKKYNDYLRLYAIFSDINKEIQKTSNKDAVFVIPTQFNGILSYSNVSPPIFENYLNKDFKRNVASIAQLSVNLTIGKYVLDTARYINTIHELLEEMKKNSDSEELDYINNIEINDNGYFINNNINKDDQIDKFSNLMKKYLHKLKSYAITDINTDNSYYVNPNSNTVTLYYASAIDQGHHKNTINNILITGAYYGALKLAYNQSINKNKKIKVILTPLGLGVFQATLDDILRSIKRAIFMFDLEHNFTNLNEYLEVNILFYSGAPRANIEGYNFALLESNMFYIKLEEELPLLTLEKKQDDYRIKTKKLILDYNFNKDTMVLSQNNTPISKFVYEPISLLPLEYIDDPIAFGNSKPKPLNIHIVESRVTDEIHNPTNKDALFVLPSQFNGAEYPNKEKIVTDISEYDRDPTGGPAGQLSCNINVGYFIIDNAENENRKPGINALKYLLDYVKTKVRSTITNIDDELYLLNGYLQLPQFKSLSELTHTNSILDELKTNLNKLYSIAMTDIDINNSFYSNESKPKNYTVNLFYASAVPVLGSDYVKYNYNGKEYDLHMFNKFKNLKEYIQNKKELQQIAYEEALETNRNKLISEMRKERSITRDRDKEIRNEVSEINNDDLRIKPSDDDIKEQLDKLDELLMNQEFNIFKLIEMNLKFQYDLSSILITGQYYGALSLAYKLAIKKQKKIKVYFLPLGTGVFRNKFRYLSECIKRSIVMFDNEHPNINLNYYLKIIVLLWNGKRMDDIQDTPESTKIEDGKTYLDILNSFNIPYETSTTPCIKFL